MINFSIIGGAGWRAEFYFRIAAALPGRFRVAGALVRDAAKAEALRRKWGVATFDNLDSLLASDKPAFVVTSVPVAPNAAFLRELAGRRVPVLSETPPAKDLDAMKAISDLAHSGARIQIAEQYPFQPLHAARIAIAQSGLLGPVTQAQVSAAHAYHGSVLIRRLLGVGFEDAEITAMRFTSPLVAGPGRAGPPTEEKMGTSTQDIAWLRFGEKLGVHDFTGDQYFSWVRSNRVLVRGAKGEISNTEVRYLRDFLTPVTLTLSRQNAGENGNLEGWHLKGILAGDEWVYRNPFAPGRLSDDEIAIATCLDKMAAYAQGGPSFYGLAKACQDHYLGLAIREAIATGQKVKTQRQPWAPA